MTRIGQKNSKNNPRKTNQKTKLRVYQPINWHPSRVEGIDDHSKVAVTDDQLLIEAVERLKVLNIVQLKWNLLLILILVLKERMIW